MKNLFYIFLGTFTLISCNGMSEPIESDETEETVEVSEEAEGVSEQTDWEDLYIDTSYYGETESKFSTPQLNDSVNYVFWVDEMNVYDDLNLSNLIFTVPKGEAVIVKWRSSIAPDSLGFNAQTAEIVYEGQSGYCGDGFLSKFPFPEEDGTDMLSYCLANLHLIEPPFISESIPNSDYAYEGESSTVTYNFEGGIQLVSENAYEYSGDFLRLPKLQVQEALLLINELHWLKLSPLTEGRLPAIGTTILPTENDYEEFSVTVEENGTGFITLIDYMFGEGCANWCKISWEDNGTVINVGGGC